MMSPFVTILLISLAISIQGRPRRHKHKKAHVHRISQINEPLQPQEYQQFGDGQAPAGPPKNVNVYNMNLHKFDKNNKMNAKLNAHSVAITMQGPGMIELRTGQQQIAAGAPRPDHTIKVIKNTPDAQGVHVMKVKNIDSQLPVNLPLTELPGPVPASKQEKSTDLVGQHLPVNPSQSKIQGHIAASKIKQVKPVALEPIHELKELGVLIRKPHRKVPLHHRIHTPKANTYEQQPDAAQQPQGPSLRLRQKVNKEEAQKILTKIESTIPINVQQPKHEERVFKGHQIKLTNAGEAQRVFGKVDAKNVALTMQGPGTASVTSRLNEGTQTIIFDPKPPELCPDKNCPQQRGGKRHVRRN